VRDGPRIRARLGVVPQDDTLDNELTVRENIVIYGRYFGLSRREARVRTERLLEFVQLTERANDRVDALSGGLKRRLTIARSLVNEPDVLLLDEPTTGLDPRSKLEVQRFIREVRAEHDATILLCTHDLAEAEALADRVGILDRGELLFLEPVEDVKRRYGVATLEEAFFAATGRTFEEENEDDAERGVFA
jgi:lipooligosaccharide transport system ATP-binding protein